MKSACDNCLVCYCNEYTKTKVVNNIIVECSSQIEDTKENREGIEKEIAKNK